MNTEETNATPKPVVASNGVVLLPCRVCKTAAVERDRPYAYTKLFRVLCPLCKQSGPEMEAVGDAVGEWNIQQNPKVDGGGTL